MLNTKQKHLLDTLLSSSKVFGRCINIIKPEYFDGELRHAVRFIVDYYNKYSSMPDTSTILSEYPDVNISTKTISTDKVEYTCDEIEVFCRESAVALAMENSFEDLEKRNFGNILVRMQEAVGVSLQKELGWQFFGDEEKFKQYLKEALEDQERFSTGIDVLDRHLGGGLARKQFTLASANSGVGKSVILNNLAYNYAAQGFDVVLLSLELANPMVFTRTTSIVTGFDIDRLEDEQVQVATAFSEINRKVQGSLMINRIGPCCANDIRSYLTHYEMQMDRTPDVLVIDYLDKMHPNQGNGRLSISERDEYKAAQTYEILHDYNMIGISASQQNRDAIGNADPQQNVIAGGMTKVNEVDNYFSLYMDDVMKKRGELMVKFLKTRSSSGRGMVDELFFDQKNLRITSPGTTSNNGLFDISRRMQKISSFSGKDLSKDDFEFHPPQTKPKHDNVTDISTATRKAIEDTAEKPINDTENYDINTKVQKNKVEPKISSGVLNFMESLDEL